MRLAMSKEQEKPVLVWDTCEIAREQAKFLVEQAKEEGKTLDEEQAFELATNDYDLYQFEWDCLCDELTEIMSRINPDGRWYCEVSNFGWRHLDGHCRFKAESGRVFLQAVLPKTDCTFKLYDRGSHIVVDNAHHDAPCGGETYTIEPDKRWVIKALYERDENDDFLYWSNKDGWVDKDLATVFSDRDKNDAVQLPVARLKMSSRSTEEELVTAGEWEEVENED